MLQCMLGQYSKYSGGTWGSINTCTPAFTGYTLSNISAFCVHNHCSECKKTDGEGIEKQSSGHGYFLELHNYCI